MNELTKLPVSVCAEKVEKLISSSLKRDEIALIDRTTGCENFLSKRDQFILYSFVDFRPVKRFKNRSGASVFRCVSNGASKSVLDVLKSVYLNLRKVKNRQFTIVKFVIYNRYGNCVGCLESR